MYRSSRRYLSATFAPYARPFRLVYCGAYLCLGLLILMGTAACDSVDSDDPGGDPSDGSFEATISGAVDMSTEGRAQFSDPRDSDATGWQFTIELIKSDPITQDGQGYYFEVFVSNRQLEALPEPGTYDMVSYFNEDAPDLFSGEFSLSPTDGEGEYIRFEAVDGQVEFTDVSREGISGSVTFTGEKADTGETVSVSGTFNATRAIPTI